MAIARRANLDEISLHVPATGAGPEFARAMGLVYRSSMWRLDLPAGAQVPGPSFPHDVVARPFGAWLAIDKYVELLNRSFAGHPTPLSWTVAEIEYFHGRPEFDPSTTLLLTRGDGPDQPVGFVRISVAPPEEGEAEPLGDIRLVGVLPEWRGRGLGRDLLRWAVNELRTRGAGRISLSVEAENELALGLYRRTGFEPVIEWPHWVRSIASGAPAGDGV
jgi:mycothiol synthase